MNSVNIRLILDITGIVLVVQQVCLGDDFKKYDFAKSTDHKKNRGHLCLNFPTVYRS